TKFVLSPQIDLRVAYARGFRAPTLRELYFWFFDASHSIRGNKNLRAESSDSFNAFINYHLPSSREFKANLVLGGFYNHFDDKISEALDPENPSVWSYFNLERFKTTGASLNTTLFWKSLQTTAGLQWVGTYNQYSEIASQNLPEFHWTPEVNANVIY